MKKRAAGTISCESLCCHKTYASAATAHQADGIFHREEIGDM